MGRLKRVMLVSGAVIALIAPPSPSMATCSLSEALPDAVRLQAASSVVRARPVAVRYATVPAPTEAIRQRPVETRLQVLEVFKGKVGKEINLTLAPSGVCPDLDVHFALGREYVLFFGEPRAIGLAPIDEQDPEYAKRVAALRAASRKPRK